MGRQDDAKKCGGEFPQKPWEEDLGAPPDTWWGTAEGEAVHGGARQRTDPMAS